ncbi:MAG: hypothetical protein FJ034_06755 [Chloroflexi bacterium]|nr:hypothetical protein [Chloroflexota bacterium]
MIPVVPAAVERFGLRRGEPDALIAARVAAAERYRTTSWPTGQEEEWRRFPLTGLPVAGLEGAVGATAYAGTPPPGVVFGPLAEAVQAHPDLVFHHLDGARDDALPTHTAFRALANALWSEGTFLHVPARVQVSSPLWIRRHWGPGTQAILERTIVVLEPGASVTVVEELSSEPGEDGGRLAIPYLSAHLGPGARLRYIGIQRLAADVWDLGFQRYVSDRDSDLVSVNVIVGGGRSKMGIESRIRGDGAAVRLDGLVAAGAEQRVDVNTYQGIDGKGSSSDLLFLAALYDSAKAVNYGVIRVEPTSSASGSYQECRNMLLSDKAGADPIPVLEILTNDVARCGHAATAGSIDEADLFYVMSRGVERRAAEAMLVRGFFQRVIDRLDDESVRQRTLHALAPRIGREA